MRDLFPVGVAAGKWLSLLVDLKPVFNILCASSSRSVGISEFSPLDFWRETPVGGLRLPTVALKPVVGGIWGFYT